jgi:hypothetical protein
MPNHFGKYGWIDPKHPEAAGVCDRCDVIYKRRELMPEQHYTAGRLAPNGFLVCRRCLDVPNPQIGGQRPLPPDPVPVINPRPPHDVLPDPNVLTDPQGRPLTDPAGNPLSEPPN